MGTNGEAVAILGEGSTLSGHFVGRDLTVHGVFEGEVELQGTLRVGAAGRLKGTVHAKEAEIEGSFEGEIEAARLSFGPAARSLGRYLADRLVIAEGARVEGAVNLPSEPEPAIVVAVEEAPSPASEDPAVPAGAAEDALPAS